MLNDDPNDVNLADSNARSTAWLAALLAAKHGWLHVWMHSCLKSWSSLSADSPFCARFDPTFGIIAFLSQRDDMS